MRQKINNLIWSALEDHGEDEVRRRLAIGEYTEDRPLVEEWLRFKDQQRAERGHDAMCQQTLILRSTKDAAWVAIGVSVLSLAVAITALWASLSR